MITTIQSYLYNYKHLELLLNYNRFARIPRTINLFWNRFRVLLDRQAEALINTWWLLMACLICCGVNVLAFLCKICFSASWSRRVMNISIARLIKTGTAAATFPISSSDLIFIFNPNPTSNFQTLTHQKFPKKLTCMIFLILTGGNLELYLFFGGIIWVKIFFKFFSNFFLFLVTVWEERIVAQWWMKDFELKSELRSNKYNCVGEEREGK